MEQALAYKFLASDVAQQLRVGLLQTGNLILLEANRNDKFWGCGADQYDRGFMKKVREMMATEDKQFPGEGQNKLGKMLMKLRCHLRSISSFSREVAFADKHSFDPQITAMLVSDADANSAAATAPAPDTSVDEAEDFQSSHSDIAEDMHVLDSASSEGGDVSQQRQRLRTPSRQL
jgi:hypothetical protein